MKQYHKNHIWKRGVACMLAIALAFLGITWNGLTVSNAVGAGIPNANFNTRSLSSVSDWTQDGAVENANTSKVTANWDSWGDYSGKLIKNGSGIAILSSANMTGLEAGTLYKLEVSVKTDAADEQNLQLMVRHLKADGSFITESIDTLYQNEANGTWKSLSGCFRFKSGEYANARLVVAMTDKQEGIFSKNATMYVDDASIQTVTGTSVDTVDVSYEEDLSSIQVEYDTSGYATDKPIVERSTAYYNVGQSSLHVKKDSYNSRTYLRNLGRFALQNEQPMEGSVYTWGAYVKSVDSNSFVRIDLDIYDIDGRYLGTRTGNETMLSRSEIPGEWRKMSTSAQLPAGAYYASYKIAVTEGKAEFYLDNLFGTVTENYYYKLSDWSYFTGVDEDGNINGWTTDAEVGVSDNTAAWSNGKMTRRVETLIPGAAYRLTADYTATEGGQCSILFYDVNQKKIGTLDKVCESAIEKALLTAEFVMPEEAMYAEVSFGGTGNYTLTNWKIEETLGRAIDSEWTANWVWYPEKLNTENASRYFRSHFQVADKTQISAVYLQIACDDAMEIHVNGNSEVLSSQYVDAQGAASPYQVAGKRQVLVFAITEQIQTGDNLLAVKVWNDTSYGGAVYELLICYEDGSQQTLASGVSLPVLAGKSDTGWYATGIDESAWVEARNVGVPAYSVLGDVTWWAGPVDVTSNKADRLMFNTGSASEGYLDMNKTISVTAGDMVTYSGMIANVSQGEKEAFHGSTVTGWLYQNGTLLATVPVSVKLPDANHASFTYTVPDYLPEGTYDLRLDKSKVVWGWNTNNQFGLLHVTAAKKENRKVSVRKKDNGTAGLYIEGEETSPIMYLRPHMEGLYKYHSMSNFAESDVAIYSTYNGFLDGMDYTYQKDPADSASKCIWTGWENDAPTIDTELFDYEIYRTLNLNPKANVMVQVCVDAPKWWMEENPDELVKSQDQTVVTTGSFHQTSVSMSSTLYQQQVAEVLKALVSHMENASYAHRVVGIRLVAGRTFEWMQNGVENGQLIDYSQAALDGFRGYLTNLYGTDAKLQSAWNDSSITLATVEIPNADERNTTDSVALLNPSAQRKVIDYNQYLGEASANYLLSCAGAIKENMTAQWIVGAYNGYLWNFDSSEAIGSAHTSVSKVLASDSIDFVASPANYGERISGYATGNMALSDSIAAAGKLYIIEQDNRTYLSGQSGDSLGATYTVSDSVVQITRDMSMDFIRGSGLWFYDMEGGWFDDNSIEVRIKALKTEWDKHLDNGSNNEVAVYVPEENYNYLVADIGTGDTSLSSYLMSSLYQEQRRELAAMGASYDTYMVEDVLSSTDTAKWSQYKLHIVLSPFVLTDEDASTLKDTLCQSNAVVLWVYLPGASTGGDYTGNNISNLVDMQVALNKEKKALQAKTTDGITYGNKNAGTGPWACITDTEATVLATYTSGETAAASIDNGTYISVYSAVPDVPAELLRKLCQMAGVHLYSADPSDVIETNNSYIAIHSANGGQKTIYLNPANRNRSVYDVLDARELTINDNTFTCSMKAGETRLYHVETERSISYGMEWRDTLDNPDNLNLFYNGTFDETDGTVNKNGWATGDPALGDSETQTVTEYVYQKEYGMDFEDKTEKTGLENTDMMDWALEGNQAILGFAKEDGNSVLKVDKPAAYKYIRYYGYTFAPGETYKVSFRVKSPDKAGLQVNGVNGNWTEEASITLTSDWQWFENEFSVEGEIAAYYIKFLESNESGTIYMDDFKIEKQVPVNKSVYTEGYGLFGETDYALMVESKGEFWNYGTKVEEGKQYKYQMRVKIEGAQEDFAFQPYLYDYVNSKFITLDELRMTANCDWTEIRCLFVAPAVHETNGLRFGFARSGVGKVYLDDMELYEVGAETLLPEFDTFVSDGNTLIGWEGATPIGCFAGPDGGLGVGAKGTEISTAFKAEKPLVAGCQYVLQFRADVTHADSILVTVGNAKLQPEISITEENGWKDFSCIFTPTEIKEQKIIISGEGAEISLDDVTLYRKYELGDSNGDGMVDSRDLVRYKRHMLGSSAAQYQEVATYVFSDITGTQDTIGYDKKGIIIDDEDVKAWRKRCADATN